MPQPAMRRRITLALLAPALLLLAACGSDEAAQRSLFSASPTVEPASNDERDRWGYDPMVATGESDIPVFYQALPTGYIIEAWGTGLTMPTGMDFTPDGRLLIAEQPGRIRVMVDGRLLPEPFYVQEDDLYYPPETPEQLLEFGVLSVAVDPEYASNGYVYFVYTADNPRRTILARVTDRDGKGADYTELASFDAAPPQWHVGGQMEFAPDGTIFLTVGEHQLTELVQQLDNPFGKILRINKDGTAPSDNPFVDVPGADPRIYAYGLRNANGLSLDPATGRLFTVENGKEGQDAVLEIKAGANYGWPGYDENGPLLEMEPPLKFYHTGIAPAGVEFYSHDRIAPLTGQLLFCQFKWGGALHAMSFQQDGSVFLDTIVTPGCRNAVVTGPEGFIYLLEYLRGTIYRIATDERE